MNKNAQKKALIRSQEMPKEQSGIRMPLELKNQLSALAQKKGETFNSFVLSVLRQYVEM